ncbi:beta-glucosidase 18-like isoform X2 [Mercurialis annua]|uniref:beta-glucosidase 18-like isoform X2 n=1 Tax=Mercurialis annua TaxID=3986 RepID=UPI00215EB467|nr:beta-glucosidase 18-like isoform X2 [Mercurialis annua]
MISSLEQRLLHIRLKELILKMAKDLIPGMFSPIYLDDIELMQSLGVNAYRFSISWSRILPRGRFGEVNPLGIAFYNSLIDNLLLRGIEPFVTIYHLDFPQELEDRYGSWLSPLMQEDFVYFAEICFKNFGHKTKHWITINEPNLFAEMAYITGLYPPCHCSPPFGNCSIGNSDIEPLIVMHNMILAHAKAVKLYRESFQSKQGGSIGIVGLATTYEPFRVNNGLDEEAASRAMIFQFAWLFDPIVHGDYPPEMRHYLGGELPKFSPEEINIVKGSTDFIGVNHYTALYAKDCIHSSCIPGWDRPIRGFAYTTGERNGVTIGEPTGNPLLFVVPRGMEKSVNYVKERYNNMPIYVTENGYSPPPQEQELEEAELLQDLNRVNYHKSYLRALARAIRNGADVRGYFIWSFLDNFEWASGYSLRYGIHYVDFQTLERKPKHSAKWYKKFLTITDRNMSAMMIESETAAKEEI